jgi:hypothetical protein
MDILHLVDRLEELFNESRPIPLTHSVIVDEDRILEIVDLLGKNVPDFEKLVIPGVAHMVSLEKPAEFDAAVRAFLKKVYSAVS